MEILFQDKNILAINKPAGIASVLQKNSVKAAIVTEVFEKFPEIARVGRVALEGGLLHRLDTETSGVLLFARTNAAFEFYKKNWRNEILKTYRALVASEFPLEKLPWVIIRPLGHSKKSSKKMTWYLKSMRGRPRSAQTTILSGKRNKNFCDLEIEINSGVMHQIRAHLASIRFPILGDELYGSKEVSPWRRLALHSYQMKFKNGLVIEAPPPS